MNFKKIWFYSGCAMILGLILAVIGFFSGAKSSVTFGRDGFQVMNPTPHTVKQENMNAFESIDLNIKHANIEFIPSDHYGAVVNYLGDENQYSCAEKDGTLVISDDKSNHEWLNFGFFTNQHDTIKIYVPQAVKFKNLKVENHHGDFTATNFTSESADIQVSFGSLKLTDADCGAASIKVEHSDSSLKNIKVRNLIFNNDFGRSDFENISASSILSNLDHGSLNFKTGSIGSLEIENSFGDINIDSLESNGTNIKSEHGKINIAGALKGRNEMHSDYENVNVKTSVPQNQYTYSLSSEHGHIEINGREFDNKNVIQSGNSENTLFISSVHEDVSLEFVS